MGRSKKSSVGRRNFLKSAVVGVATLAAPMEAVSATPVEAEPHRSVPLIPPTETDPPPDIDVLTTDHPGSDFMVDVIKSLGFEYVCANPGSAFRALHESILNYGGNQNPEFITCCHEESSVAMAHGYAKIEGRPLCVLAHGTVGLQHAAMAIYNAYCDRVPVYIVIGNSLDAATRHTWVHTVQDAALMVRDYVKWDDTPVSLQHFAESAVRAYKIAMTPPMEPVLLVADTDLQESPNSEAAKLRIPKLTVAEPPQGDSGSVAEAARLLVQAENPVIVVDKAARTQAGMEHLVELAELLQAPVIDKAGRMNFPTRHPLNQSTRERRLIADADVVLALEVAALFDVVNSSKEHVYRTFRPIMKTGAKLISITANDLYMKANYQDAERYAQVDLAMAADAETTVPPLIEAMKQLITPARKTEFQARGANLAAAHHKQMEQLRADASYAWDASPVSTARLSAELWEAIKDEDWSMVSYIMHFSWWPLRTWPIEKHYQFNGGPGAAGMGYNAPAAVGAALANRKHGRLTVNIQCDGDLMYAPGVLWTAAHHRIPILNVMHNNRAYHQELMHLQRMANRHNRGIDRAWIGTTIEDPNIDFAKLAQSMGVYAEGPITDPKDLGAAIRRAVAVVKRGEPALVDVVTQPR